MDRLVAEANADLRRACFLFGEKLVHLKRSGLDTKSIPFERWAELFRLTAERPVLWQAWEAIVRAILGHATYTGVPWADRDRLAGYVERVRKSQLTRPEEDREMAALMKAAEDSLTPARRLRLQAYYEKAIRAES